MYYLSGSTWLFVEILGVSSYSPFLTQRSTFLYECSVSWGRWPSIRHRILIIFPSGWSKMLVIAPMFCDIDSNNTSPTFNFMRDFF